MRKIEKYYNLNNNNNGSDIYIKFGRRKILCRENK